MNANVKRALFIAVAVVVPGGLLLGGVLWWRRRYMMSGWVADSSAEIAKWEGSYNWPYLDTKNLPTTGIGNLVTDPYSLPWKVGDRLATRDEIARNWAALKRDTGGKPARSYKGTTALRLTDADVRKLFAHRINDEFVPQLAALYPGFETFPTGPKRALLDMIFTLGKGGLSKFNTLRVALGKRDFKAASLAMRRKGARPERDEANERLMASGS